MAHGVTDIAGFVKLVTPNGQGQSESTNPEMFDPDDSRLPHLGRVSPAGMQTCLYTDMIHASRE